MPCRHEISDPLKCEMCGAYLWVSEDMMFCGDCGVVMPCSMVRRPVPDTRGGPRVSA
ncbi:MAG: hypothetical protein L3K03_00180 [Thermoplasmata archaeon]|nr:hypothetical protein [Thermoplasmata archaeon]